MSTTADKTVEEVAVGGTEHKTGPSNDALSGPTVFEVRGLEDTVCSTVTEIGVVGNYTHPDNVFQHDLAPGEKIIKEIEVWIPRGRITCYEMAMIVSTAGMYYVWMLILRMIGCRLLYAARARIALTTAGRILRWKSDINGAQGPWIICCCRSFVSATVISSFNIHKLSHIQRSYSKVQITLLGCLSSGFCVTTGRHYSSLLFCFDKYPNQGIYDSINDSFGLSMPHAVTMERLTASGSGPAFGLNRGMLVSRFPVFSCNIFSPAFQAYIQAQIARIVFPLTQIGIVCGQFSARCSAACAGVVGNWDNTYEQQLHLVTVGGTKEWKDVIEFENLVLQFARPADHLTGPQCDASTFEITTEHGSIITHGDNPKVRVNPKLLGLLPGEEVVDVWPSRPKWTFQEILLTIMTASIYYWLVVRYVHMIKGAIIITRKRLFEVFFDLKTPTPDTFDCFVDEDSAVPSFTVVVRFWFFGRLSQGFMEYTGDVVYAHIKTKYGGLVILPHVAYTNCCIPICYGMEKAHVERMKSFLMNFAMTNEPEVVQAPGAAPMEGFTQTLWRPSNGEKPVFLIKSESLAGCEQKCCRLLSCGIQPIAPYQEILISTHRLWASARSVNAPWCMQDNICLCGVKHELIFWKPLADVRGWRTFGNVVNAENCYNRILPGLPCCPPFQMSLDMQIADLKGFPISLNKNKKTDLTLGVVCPWADKEYAFVGQEDVGKMREIMSAVLSSANVKRGGKPQEVRIEMGKAL